MHPELVRFGNTVEAVLSHRGTAEDAFLLLNIGALFMYAEEREGLERFSQSQRFVHAIVGLQREVGSGGFHSFFSSGCGALAYDVVPALRAVSSIAFLQIAGDALDLFGRPSDLSQEQRWKHLRKVTADGDLSPWEACDSAFYVCEEPLDTLVLNFVERHIDDIRC